jgi:hypothetical protein
MPGEYSARIWESQVYGRVARIYITPDEYATPIFAARLADKWLEVAPELPGSVQDLAVAIRAFLAHLGEQVRMVDGDDRFDLPDLRLRHLDAWETALLRDQRQRPTDTRYKHAVHLFALLRRTNDDLPGVLREDVVGRLERSTRLRHIRNEGEPEFPPEEADRLREAARRLVNEALTAHRGENPPAGPTRDVIVALHVLLSLGTGEPPEVLRALRVEDVIATPIPGRDDGVEHLDAGKKLAALVRRHGVQSFCVRYVKNRAAERYEQVYTRRDEQVFKPLTALIMLTADGRATVSSSNLWLAVEGQAIVEPAWTQKRWTLRSWVNRVVLAESGEQARLSEPLKFSRLRKSVTTTEALANPGRYLRGSRRHTAETFFQHYTNSAVLRAEAGRVLMQAVSELFDAAVHGPIIVTPAAEELLAAGHHAPTLDRDTADRLLTGALETGIAACRNPRDSPAVPCGELCPFSTTGDCFTCPNALITQHHLPAVLRLQELTDPNKAANVSFWQERWKPIYDAITKAILPAFPTEAIAAASKRTHTVLLDPGLLNDLGGADAPE